MAPTAKRKPTVKWKAAPAALVTAFEKVMRRYPEAAMRKMFGYPAAFVNGNMVGGLFQDCMMLRLSADDLAAIQEQAGAKPFEPMPRRVMREYVVVPASIRGSKAELQRWVGRAIAYAGSLPAKPANASPKKSAPRGRSV